MATTVICQRCNEQNGRRFRCQLCQMLVCEKCRLPGSMFCKVHRSRKSSVETATPEPKRHGTDQTNVDMRYHGACDDFVWDELDKEGDDGS